jgi:hypothetical protein
MLINEFNKFMNPLLKALLSKKVSSIFFKVFRLIPIVIALLLIAFLFLISNIQGRVFFGSVFAFLAYHAKSWTLTMDRLILKALLDNEND